LAKSEASLPYGSTGWLGATDSGVSTPITRIRSRRPFTVATNVSPSETRTTFAEMASCGASGHAARSASLVARSAGARPAPPPMSSRPWQPARTPRTSPSSDRARTRRRRSRQAVIDLLGVVNLLDRSRGAHRDAASHQEA